MPVSRLYSELCRDSALSRTSSCGLARKLSGSRLTARALRCSRWSSRAAAGRRALCSSLRSMRGVLLPMLMRTSGPRITAATTFFSKKSRICDTYCCFCGSSHCSGGIASSTRTLANGMRRSRRNCSAHSSTLGTPLRAKPLMRSSTRRYSSCRECCNRPRAVSASNRCTSASRARPAASSTIASAARNWPMLALSRTIRSSSAITRRSARASRPGCSVSGRRRWRSCHCAARRAREVDSR
ncbi:Uncharacterised protein [Klebsiella pneumoniae]|nr:hypothetical protein PAERUG_P2_London_28_IMP_1_06_05_01370 [Pseudomonas aeruginosa]SVJ78179.1 Uncharacterised protein [Klebsiella pneumoniae]CRP41932.1 hypothetical protein PAERUG_P18_London_17_VIM_2_04_10_03397 [Pseudomonas aeruginosa]CRQ22394.1 hypothetical protein PAERUG_E16_London_17_VIM_2_04_14_00054 [Pseudomonas aeruginosa]CRQ62831.1 hypothetical protein PAERUG_E5_London_17_VIM_2_12_12_03714 [Pseudomonas aeruginosa]